MIPEYDTNALPCIELPYNNEKEVTRKYLGKRAVTGQEYATLNIFMVNDTEAKALYDFWKDDCNYGATAFLVAIPLFGAVYDKTMPDVLVEFMEDISAEKADTHWKQGIKVKVMGTVDYIQDDSLNYITDDSGNLIVTDSTSNSNKEITYGS